VVAREEEVVAVAAAQGVGAGTARQEVVARAAGDLIGAGAAVDRVAPAAAGEGVASAASAQPVRTRVAVNYPPAPYVTVECENFTGDPANPELDQLIGRFNNLNGKLGVMAVRKLKDRPLFIARCNDAAKTGQGFIVPLDDDDLKRLVDAKARGDEAGFDRVLHERFQRKPEQLAHREAGLQTRATLKPRPPTDLSQRCGVSEQITLVHA
jgi:hypothetical protein